MTELAHLAMSATGTFDAEVLIAEKDLHAEREFQERLLACISASEERCRWHRLVLGDIDFFARTANELRNEIHAIELQILEARASYGDLSSVAQIRQFFQHAKPGVERLLREQEDRMKSLHALENEEPAFLKDI